MYKMLFTNNFNPLNQLYINLGTGISLNDDDDDDDSIYNLLHLIEILKKLIHIYR